MLKAREGANSGQRLDSAGAFGGVPATVWGLPAIPSTAIAELRAGLAVWQPSGFCVVGLKA